MKNRLFVDKINYTLFPSTSVYSVYLILKFEGATLIAAQHLKKRGTYFKEKGLFK